MIILGIILFFVGCIGFINEEKNEVIFLLLILIGLSFIATEEIAPKTETVKIEFYETTKIPKRVNFESGTIITIKEVRGRYLFLEDAVLVKKEIKISKNKFFLLPVRNTTVENVK